MVLRPRRSGVGGAVLTCGLLAGCAPQPAPTVIRTDPARLVLTLSELPYPGFQVAAATPDSGRRSNRAEAGGSPAVLQRLEQEGRTTGYSATYTRAVQIASAVGPVVIQSVATAYRTDGDATAALGRDAAGLAGAGDTRLSAGRVGQAAVAFTSQRSAAQVTYAQYVVEWRELNVVNAVVVEGNALTLDLGYALTLARLQQRGEHP